MKICLIPARGGSRRIKNKNIKNFFGKEIIYYSINKAFRSKLFDKVIVSTDSKKIANIAKSYGAETFIRAKNLCDNFATDLDVIKNFVNHYRKKIHMDYLCYLYPLNPLLTISTLRKCKMLLDKGKCHKIIVVSKYNSNIERAFVFKNKYIEFWKKQYEQKRSQDSKDFYRDTGTCYWYNLNKIPKFSKKMNFKTKAVVLNTFEYFDVNTLKDWNVLKKIYKYKLYLKK